MNEYTVYMEEKHYKKTTVLANSEYEAMNIAADLPNENFVLVSTDEEITEAVLERENITIK